MKDFKSKKEFADFVKRATASQLKKCGFGAFQKYDKKDKESHYLKPGQVHYLIPGKFYSFIPIGMKVIDVFGKRSSFKKGFDDDVRYGCLSYGVIK